MSYIITLSYSCFLLLVLFYGVAFLLACLRRRCEDFCSALVGLSGVTVFLPLSLRYQFCLRILFLFSSSTFLHHQSIQQSLALLQCSVLGFLVWFHREKKKSVLLSIPLTLSCCCWLVVTDWRWRWRSLSPPGLFLLS